MNSDLSLPSLNKRLLSLLHEGHLLQFDVKELAVINS